MAEDNQSSKDDPISADDWQSALSEEMQASAAASVAASSVRSADQGSSALAAVFSELGSSLHAGEGGGIELVADIPIAISVELGTARVPVKSMMQLGQGSVIELENRPGEPLLIFANGQLIAKGEVVTVNDHLGIRLTQLVRPKAVA